ncbi:MarR family transcriptional regulator [Streptomyces lavendulae]|uniref:MarR family transcriptional regulator n=1 Tax=Streptomyces lavendulae TaxID=1914 RepID=UPI0033EB2E4A
MVTSQFEFLRFLRDHPGARVADLAAGFAIGIGPTGKGIDRLEKQAWVRRRSDPSDRRSSLPELTDDGRQPVETAEATFTETPAELTADTLGGPSGLATAQILPELRSACERDRIGLPTG